MKRKKSQESLLNCFDNDVPYFYENDIPYLNENVSLYDEFSLDSVKKCCQMQKNSMKIIQQSVTFSKDYKFSEYSMQDINLCVSYLNSHTVIYELEMQIFRNKFKYHERWKTLRVLFTVILVLHATTNEKFIENMYFIETSDELFLNYPFLHDHKDIDLDEMNYLKNFVNFLKILKFMIPIKANKHFILLVLEKLEGSGKHYITGGGARSCCSRRILIMESEGNLIREKRSKCVCKKNKKSP
jgi:hypothetical protein